jgi:hypothetical protein
MPGVAGAEAAAIAGVRLGEETESVLRGVPFCLGVPALEPARWRRGAMA